MIKTFIFVEDGSVDLDELKSSVGDDVLVIPYRQGATPPAIQQPREPVSRREVNIKDRLLDLMIEFDEMGFAPTTVCKDPEGYAKKWKDQVLEEVKALKAENAAMRKQISEMLTPLCTLGDKLYHYELSFGDGFDENGKVIHTSSMDIIETVVTRDNIWRMCDLVQNKRAFFSKEALAASFKERFQKGREQFVKEIKDDKRRTD